MSRVSETTRKHRQDAIERVKLRELAHRKLDEILDMYLDGDPLRITIYCSWISMHINDRLDITIREGLL